jgi:hypothetical protein
VRSFSFSIPPGYTSILHENFRLSCLQETTRAVPADRRQQVKPDRLWHCLVSVYYSIFSCPKYAFTTCVVFQLRFFFQ